jgi:hypothetical protein
MKQDLEYQFTITGGHVTAMQEVLGSHTHDLPLPSNAYFSVGAGTVTETLIGPDSVKVIVYDQQAGSTLYDKIDVSKTFTHPSTAHGGYAFTVNSSGVVAAEQHVEIHGGLTQTENVHIPLGAVFSAWPSMVFEQTVKGNEIDTITYIKPAGSTLFAVQNSEQTYIEAGSATTLLDVNPEKRMEFTFDTSGNVTQAQRLDPDGVLNAVLPSPHVAFIRLGSDNSYVEKLTTHGSESSYVVYYEGQSTNGVYTEIAHGSGSTVDLPGLHAQVTAAEQTLLTGATTANPTGWII